MNEAQASNDKPDLSWAAELEADAGIWEVEVTQPESPSTGAQPFCRLKPQTVVVNLAIILTLGVFSLVYGSLFKTGLGIVASIISMAGATFVATAGFTILFYPVSICVLLIGLLQWVNSFGHADRVHIAEDGLAIGWPGVGFTKFIEWEKVTSIFLFCPHHTMIPQKWLVGFGTIGGVRPVTIRLPLFDGKSQVLLDVLKRRMRGCPIDPALLELWEPAIADSRTELWMKSLENAPGGDRLLPLLPGSHIGDGRYVIISRLGVGGQGTAFLARDKSKADEANEGGVDVVVKETLLPLYVDPNIRQEAEQRFNRETNLLARLVHPCIVKLLDSFIGDHRGYTVLEYIDGSNLRQLVKKDGPLSSERTAELASMMCDILDYLHELEPPVVHRDFTPDNLMLDSKGNLKLIDFNVAREMETTRTATIVGKHAYIPPEQFRGQPTCASDVYAMGCTLHYLLTGQDPDPITQSHPADVNEAVDRRLDQVIARATDPELAGRYQTVKELRQDLEGSGSIPEASL